jgi:hypothetical protein
MGTKRRIKGNRGGGRSRVAKVKKKIKEAGGEGQSRETMWKNVYFARL